MRGYRPARRLAILLVTGSLHLAMTLSRSWLHIHTVAGWRAWDRLSLALAVLGFPLFTAVLLCRWARNPPVREWRAADAAVFSVGTLLLWYFLDDTGFWVQETRIRFPPWLFRTLLSISGPPSRVMLALFVATLLVLAAAPAAARAIRRRRVGRAS